MASIRQDGMIRVSWPKKASGVASDVAEGDIRDVAMPLGLVDVRVCAVDDTWSGPNRVSRRENRASQALVVGDRLPWKVVKRST